MGSQEMLKKDITTCMREIGNRMLCGPIIKLMKLET
jgi:hypothetical protein